MDLLLIQQSQQESQLTNLVKLGFVNTGSGKIVKLKIFMKLLLRRKRQIIFSQILHRVSSLSSSVKEYDPRKHINFLIETLIRAENFLTNMT